METIICLVCLKRSKKNSFGGVVKEKDDPVFWYFAKDYLGISSNADKPLSFVRKEVFCENCEYVISSICKLYLELLQAQLRLSSKLEEFLKLLEGSEGTVSFKMGRLLVKSLAEQLGFRKAADVVELRSVLVKKCKLKTSGPLPKVFLEHVMVPIKIEVSPSDFLEEQQVDTDSVEIIDENIHCSDDDDHVSETSSAPEYDPLLLANEKENTEEDGADNENPEIKTEPLDSDEEEEVAVDDPIININHQEVNESDSSFEPDADNTSSESASNSSTDSDSDSDSDWSTKKRKRRSAIVSKPSPNKKPAAPVNQTEFTCPTCSKEFGTRKGLSHHVYQVHSEKIPCPKCQKPFKTRSGLKEHMIAFHNAQPHICFQCGESFKSAEELRPHSTQIHGGVPPIKSRVITKINPLPPPDPLPLPSTSKKKGFVNAQQEEMEFTCPSCSKGFPTRKKLYFHKFQVHNERRYQCQECKNSFKSKHGVKHHVIAFHKPESHPCPHCKKTYRTKDYLRTHIAFVHPDLYQKENGEQYQCSICSRSYLRKTLLNKHLLTCGKPKAKRGPLPSSSSPLLKCHKRQNNSEDAEDQLEFPCSKCPKTFSSAISVDRHMYKVHTGKIFACPECGKNLKSKYYLQQHIIAFHNPETHPCPHCGKIMKTKEYLNSHIRYAHNDKKGKPATCDRCGKSFGSLTQMRRHFNRIHAEKIESPCPFCGKIFSSAFRVTKHIETTHGEKRYKCTECETSLKSKAGLDEHMRALHNPGSHGCPHCGKIFKTGSLLKSHIDLVHLEILKRFRCPNCVIVYSNRGKLNRHLLKCTKDRPLYVNSSSAKVDPTRRSVVKRDDQPDEDGKFPCPRCPRVYETAAQRSRHLHCVHSERRYMCPHCGVMRQTSTLLKKHITAFHEPKNRVCPHCGKTLATGYMPVHLQLVHPEFVKKLVRYRCSNCPQGYYTRRQLNKHLLECGGGSSKTESIAELKIE